MTRRQLTSDESRAMQVLNILAGCELIKTGSSINGGTNYYFPQVVEIVDGPPEGLVIRILPGQMPSDFAAKADVIAYHLGIAAVNVVPLEPPLILLELLPYPAPHGHP